MKTQLSVLGSVLFLLTTLGLLACSTATEPCDAVKQDRIYQSYRVIYDKGRDETEVSAQFRFGDGTGTTLAMSGGCEIKHSNYSLNPVKLFGTAYVAQEATFREEHAFTFKDADGKSYTNSLKLVPLSYKVKPTSFSSGGDWVIEWEGPAEDSKDEFVLEVSGDNVFAILNGQKMASNKVSFKPSRVMKPLKPGSYTVRLQRRRSGPLQQGASAGGNLIVVYSAEKIVVDVVE